MKAQPKPGEIWLLDPKKSDGLFSEFTTALVVFVETKYNHH